MSIRRHGVGCIVLIDTDELGSKVTFFMICTLLGSVLCMLSLF
jgi:hypothetical protein